MNAPLLRRLVALALVLAGPPFTGSRSQAQSSALASRPGLVEGEGEPSSRASCETMGAVMSGLVVPAERIDLWVTGALTLVQTDGTLWYLAICSSPGIRVMCVAYSDNGLKLGDQVMLRGAFRIQDPHHAVLDPCLASRS